MKAHIIAVVFTLLCLSVGLNAQPCYNQITTNPDSPENIPCPDMENVFDWRVEDIPSNSSVNPFGGTFKSPYYDGINPFLDFLTEDIFPTYHDFEPEDGWELIGEYFNPEEPDDFACFVMYNRFESFLRIFTTLPQLSSATNYANARVTLSAPGGNNEGQFSALLSPSAGISQPLDAGSIPSTKVTNKYVNVDTRFNFFDVPVEYDPCTCNLSGTNLQISFGRTDLQVIDLYGRYAEVGAPLASIVATDQNLFTSDFLSSIGQMGASYGDGAGNHIFNTWNALVLQHNAWKGQHDRLKSDYEKIEAFNKGLGLVLKSKFGPIVAPFLASKAIEVDGVSLTGKDVLNDFLQVSQLFGAGVKKDVDASGKRLDRLGTSTLTHGELVIQGSIETDYLEARSFTRALPGSNTADCNNPERYPLYNEVLGRFALLSTPKVTRIGEADMIEFPNPGALPNTLPYINFLTKLHLKFDPESLEYVLNPAAGIISTETEIWGSLEFAIPLIQDSLEWYDIWDLHEDRILNYHGLPFERVETNLITSYKDSTRIVLTTPLLPISCLGEYDTQLRFYGRNAYPNYSDLDVRLKLLVDYRFEGERQALQLYTYPVNKDYEEIQPYFGDGVPPGSDFLDLPSVPVYPDITTLETTHYTEDQIIFAWSSIEIDGNLTTAPGVTVEIISPNIALLDGAKVSSDIWLRNGFSPFTSCEPIEEVLSASLAAYCDSHTYQAKFASYTIPEEESAILAARAEEEARQAQASRQSIALRAFPNPLEDFGTLEFVLPADMPVSAYLSDMHGQRLQELVSPRDLPAGRHLFDLNLVNVPPGMYLLTLQTPEGPHTVKLVRL